MVSRSSLNTKPRPIYLNLDPETVRAPTVLMKVLLQNKTTLYYVQGARGWTTQVEKARVFGSGLEAFFFCLDHRMANMQILGKFADARMNFSVPVTDLRVA